MFHETFPLLLNTESMHFIFFYVRDFWGYYWKKKNTDYEVSIGSLPGL